MFIRHLNLCIEQCLTGLVASDFPYFVQPPLRMSQHPDLDGYDSDAAYIESPSGNVYNVYSDIGGILRVSDQPTLVPPAV
eukprot:673429-Pyramimonas_sp.AAC.1